MTDNGVNFNHEKKNDQNECPWLKSYPSFVPHQIDEFEFDNLGDFLTNMFAKYANLPAYTCFGTTLSFAEIEKRSHAFAAYLMQMLHYKQGYRFAIMMPNLLQFPIVFYGCLLAGIEVVNVNPMYTPRELEHQLHDSEAKGIIIAESFAYKLAEVRNNLPNLKDIIITQIGDELSWIKGTVVNAMVRYIKKQVPNYYFEQNLYYKSVIRKGRKLSFKPAPVKPNDVAVLQYTGGTTGLAKGAMLTHRNLIANATQIDYWIGDVVSEPSIVLITALPLYHVFCCTTNTLCLPNRGMHSVLIVDPRNIKSFVKTLRKYPFGVMTVVNTLLKGLLHSSDFKALDFSSLKFVVAGGMALERVVADQWQDLTNNIIVEGYGLTETAPIITVNRLDNTKYTNGIGYPLPGTIVKLCNDDGQRVDFNEPGEIWVKGPQVMKGYWNQEEETKNAFSKDGWFKTGDIAIMDEAGYLKIVDRKKDMIIVSGFNVYPNEVEDVISKFDGVLEVACIGVKDEKTGAEKVKVFIVAKDKKPIDESALRAYVKENLTGYKRPRLYEFIDELPKSNVGKVLRKELVKRENEKQKKNS